MAFILEVYLSNVDVPIRPVVKAFDYHETTYGSSTFYLHVISKEWRKWDSIVSADPRVPHRLRWGDLSPSGERWASWKKVMFSLPKFRYSANEVEVWVQGVDCGFALSERDSEHHFMNKIISEIVAEIAEKAGFREPRIEPTSGVHTLYQGHHSDATFIRDVLLPRAVSRAGRSDYRFYIKDGSELVFEPPDLRKLVATYKLRTDPTNPEPDSVPSFDVTYRQLYSASEDSGVVQVRGYNPYSKEPVTVKVSDDNADFQYAASIPPRVPSGPTSGEAVTAVKQEQVMDRGRAIWGRNARKLFQAEVKMLYDYELTVGGSVELNVRDDRGLVHYTAGRWFLAEVDQWYRPKASGTTLHLERRAHS